MKGKKQSEGGYDKSKGGEEDSTGSCTWRGRRGCVHVHDCNAELLAIITVTWFATKVPFVPWCLEHNGVVSGCEFLGVRRGKAILEGSTVHRVHIMF